MIITAKFASTCPCCAALIEPGAKVEWSKGSRAVHVACVGAPASSPRISAAPRTAARPGRAWRPCGYPGCNPAHCDECDGVGYVASGGRYRY